MTNLNFLRIFVMIHGKIGNRNRETAKIWICTSLKSDIYYFRFVSETIDVKPTTLPSREQNLVKIRTADVIVRQPSYGATAWKPGRDYKTLAEVLKPVCLVYIIYMYFVCPHSTRLCLQQHFQNQFFKAIIWLTYVLYWKCLSAYWSVPCEIQKTSKSGVNPSIQPGVCQDHIFNH